MDIINIINSVGFPIFVSVFFLLKLDNTLKTIAEKLSELNKTINNYTDINKKIPPQNWCGGIFNEHKLLFHLHHI